MVKNTGLTKHVRRSPRLPAEIAKNVAADAKAMKDIIAEKAAEVQAMDTGNHKKTWQTKEDAEQKLHEAAVLTENAWQEKEAAGQKKKMAAALEAAALTPRSQLRWRRQTTPEGEERPHSPERKQVIAEREAMTPTKGIASNAKKIVFGAGAAVFGRFGALKARGLDAIKFAKDSSSKTSKGIAVRVAAGKANIGARVSNVKARAVEAVAGIKETTYGLATKVVTNSALARGYIVDKLSVAKGTVAKLTAYRVVARSYGYVVDTLSGAKGQVANRIAGTNARIVERVTYLIEDSKAKVKSTVTTASAKASELNIKVKDVAAAPKTKTAAAGAASGAVALGATGGAVGMVSGSFIGAAVGLVPAIFTFGLSIPIGAVIGGSAGLCVGTTVGGTTGLVAGGAAGYKKDSISSGTKKVFAQAGEGLRYTKDTAGASRQYVLKQVNSSASYLRARVQRISGTGGTETVPSESD